MPFPDIKDTRSIARWRRVNSARPGRIWGSPGSRDRGFGGTPAVAADSTATEFEDG